MRASCLHEKEPLTAVSEAKSSREVQRGLSCWLHAAKAQQRWEVWLASSRPSSARAAALSVMGSNSFKAGPAMGLLRLRHSCTQVPATDARVDGLTAAMLC